MPRSEGAQEHTKGFDCADRFVGAVAIAVNQLRKMRGPTRRKRAADKSRLLPQISLKGRISSRHYVRLWRDIEKRIARASPIILCTGVRQRRR